MDWLNSESPGGTSPSDTPLIRPRISAKEATTAPLRRLRKAEEARAAAAREETASAERAHAEYARELLRWMLNDAAVNQGIDAPGLQERRGERTFAVIEEVGLVEARRTRGTYQGGSSGVSFRVMKGVSLRVGGSKGTFVAGEETPIVIDEGVAFVTNQRVVFRGPKQTREWKWANLISLDHHDPAPWTSLPVSNRQRTSGLLYGQQDSPLVRYRLHQGLAHYEDKVGALIDELQVELAELG